MNCYEIWVNLVPGTRDLDFVVAVEQYLGALKAKGTVEQFRIRRRKFGFGPSELGEWNISIEFRSLAQLDEAFTMVAPREEPLEGLHRAVFEKVCDYRSGLYRDFPDSVRKR